MIGSAARRLVAEDADVELAPVDVLLGERGVVHLVVDRAHAPRERGGVVHERARLVDADRGVAAQRLDEQRHAQVVAGRSAPPGANTREARRGHAVEGEELLGERLVLAERQRRPVREPVKGTPTSSSRPATATSPSEVVVEHLHQVEDELGRGDGEAVDEAL